MGSSARYKYKRCPACRSQVAEEAAVCPVCGHEFGTTEAIPKRRLAEAARSPVRSRPLRTRRRFPWGVAGVLAAVALVALGALLLLSDGRSAPATIEPTVEISAPSLVITDPPIAKTVDVPTPILPTALPTPTPPPPLEYTVQAGDTCGGIALRFGVPLATLIAVNNLDPNFCLIRVGDRLVIPLPTPTPDPNAAQPAYFSPLSADRPAQIVYTVRSGDTCSEIAQRLNVPMSVLIAQNNLDANCLIRAGQVLTVTFATPTPAQSPTPIVAQTPTPRARYDAPIVIAPAAGAQISEAQRAVTLQWLTVGLLGPEEWYVVQVQPTGAVTVPIFETKATSLRLTQDILGERTEGEIVWWVQVKRLMGVDPLTNQRLYAELSPPSVARSFVWRRPLPETLASPGNGER